MNKEFKNAIMSAIALVGAVGFAGCSSSDEIVENPNFNPEDNTVKTEFVFNVTQPEERTRQTSAIAGNSTFQGIENMMLYSFTSAPTTGSSIAAANTFPLDNSGLNPSLNATDGTSNSSKVYTMYIPNETTNFLFYATAKSAASPTAGQGKLNRTIPSGTPEATVSSIAFSLQKIAATPTDITGTQEALLAILNGIAGVEGWADLGAKVTAGTATTAERALGQAYNQFTNQAENNDVRQGSGPAVLDMVEDLFGAVNSVYINESDAGVKALAAAVLDKILTYFNGEKRGEAATPEDVYSWTGSYKSAAETVSNYPEAQGLPAGSAVLTCTSGTFAYLNTGEMGAATVSTALANITYPSELVYYCNSGLWQTTVSKNKSDYPTTSNGWADVDSWEGWTKTKVTAATRAVAMQDNITYGVAQLESNISLQSGVSSFTDNAKVVTKNELENQTFTDMSLTIHGMLIGGQPVSAGYDYLPTGAYTNVIYDGISSDNTSFVLSETAIKNYTLVLDNFKSTGDQDIVNIALELSANKDFYGVSGLIKAGQKFYLIGQLSLATESSTLDPESTINWTKTSFKSGQAGYNTNRVFVRDAKTVANFTIGSYALQKAYSTIPDLRSTQMLFGISVDLTWKTGLTFNVPLN